MVSCFGFFSSRELISEGKKKIMVRFNLVRPLNLDLTVVIVWRNKFVIFVFKIKRLCRIFGWAIFLESDRLVQRDWDQKLLFDGRMASQFPQNQQKLTGPRRIHLDPTGPLPGPRSKCLDIYRIWIFIFWMARGFLWFWDEFSDSLDTMLQVTIYNIIIKVVVLLYFLEVVSGN